MKKLFALTFAACALSLGAWAQSTIAINGTTFDVRCDNKTRTAEIVNADYRPDENRYPLTDQSRKFEDMKNNPNHILEIPTTFTAYGKEYRITKIGRCAFADFNNVEIIFVPNTVTEIDDYAFFRCKNVKEVNISPSVKRIGNRAFGFCPKLKTIALPDELEHMGERVYAESKNVIRVTSVDDDYDPAVATLMAAADNGDAPKEAKKPEKVVNRSTSKVDLSIPVNPTNNSRTYAVIIANEDYENEAKVDFAANDGTSFSDYCRKTLGIPSQNIHFRRNATRNHIINAIDWLQNIDTEGATVLFYYAGHGIPDATTASTYLLPVDGNPRNTDTGYKLSNLYSKLDNLDADRVVVFLDACFSGTKRDETMLESARGGVKVKAGAQAPTGKVIVFSATQDDQTAHSYNEQQHGMFTYFLLEKLQDTEGNVSLGELADHVHSNVVKQSRMNSNLQTPTVNAGSSLANTWQMVRLRP